MKFFLHPANLKSSHLIVKTVPNTKLIFCPLQGYDLACAIILFGAAIAVVPDSTGMGVSMGVVVGISVGVSMGVGVGIGVGVSMGVVVGIGVGVSMGVVVVVGMGVGWV